MSKIFGGSKSKSQSQSTQSSSSSNRAFDTFQNDYSSIGAPAIKSAIGARGEILDGGFEGYKKAADFNFFRDSGLTNLMGVFGSKGVLQSGAAGKALQGYGQKLLSSLLGDYLSQQSQQAGLGLSLGQLLGGAGNVATSQGQSTGMSKGSSTGGLAALIGSFTGAAAGGG